MIEKWKKSVDNGGSFGALMTDLSKAFDCLSHELLIAKLDAYGFDNKSLKLIYNYLSNRKQRVKINESFSSWEEILYGVPQSSILGPLYCPLVWICHSRKLNNKINAIHESVLRITYGDRQSSFQQLLEKDNSVSIHHRNLQVLATEMFKISRNLCPELLNDIFLKRTNPYNLRRNHTFYSRQVHSVYHGTKSLSFGA